jgi:hypothetical protein
VLRSNFWVLKKRQTGWPGDQEEDQATPKTQDQPNAYWQSSNRSP